MARTTIDFSEVEEFEAVPAGEYEAEITKIEYREPASEDKYPYLNVEVTITEDGDEQGRKVWGIWSFSPKAMWRMKQAWENLGVIEPDEEIEIDWDDDTNLLLEPDFVGVPCLVTVVEEPYEGRMRSRAEAFVSLDDAPEAEEPEEEPEPEPEPEKPARRTAARKAPAEKKSAGKKPAGKKQPRRRFQ